MTTDPHAHVPVKARAPTLRVPLRPFAVPQISNLRDLRRALAFGGLTPAARRTPEDHARITSFRVLVELLRFLDQYRRRIETGAHLRLVQVGHVRQKGRLLIEFEVTP